MSEQLLSWNLIYDSYDAFGGVVDMSQHTIVLANDADHARVIFRQHQDYDLQYEVREIFSNEQESE